MNYVRCIAENNVNCWPQAMIRIFYAHKISINEITGFPTLRVMFGSEPRKIENVLLSDQIPSSDGHISDVGDYQSKLSAVKERVAEIPKNRTVEAQKQRSEDCFRHGIPYSVGDRVRIKLSVYERGLQGGKKMAPLYSDVYIVKMVHVEGWDIHALI